MSRMRLGTMVKQTLHNRLSSLSYTLSLLPSPLSCLLSWNFDYRRTFQMCFICLCSTMLYEVHCLIRWMRIGLFSRSHHVCSVLEGTFQRLALIDWRICAVHSSQANEHLDKGPGKCCSCKKEPFWCKGFTLLNGWQSVAITGWQLKVILFISHYKLRRGRVYLVLVFA